MQFLKSAMVAASVLALGGLTACGGGQDPAPAETTTRLPQSVVAPVAPTVPVTPVTPVTPAIPVNTLALISGTATSFPTGNYALDTGYASASGVLHITGHVIEWVWPENTAFDTGFFFSQNDSSKFAFGLTDQPPSYTGYRCVSSAWTGAELSELAVVLGDPSITSVQKCPSNISIDVAAHHISFSDWTLLSDDGTQSVKLSVNASWTLQNGTLITGSGSSSSGAVNNTMPVEWIGMPIPISSPIRAVQVRPAEIPE